jgi:hypothetical protein
VPPELEELLELFTVVALGLIALVNVTRRRPPRD